MNLPEPIWLNIDLGSHKVVSEMMVDHWGGGKGTGNRGWNHAPKTMELYYGDGTRSGSTGGFYHHTFDLGNQWESSGCEPKYFKFPNIYTRYLRVRITAKQVNDSPYVVLDEIKFYGPANTPAPTRYPTPFPTPHPTAYPTAYPTRYPTRNPTAFPTT